MIGIIIICHMGMASGIKDAAVNISGNKKFFEAIEVLPSDGIAGASKKLENILSSWCELDGIIVFVDMFGGTPCNAISKMLQVYSKVDVITGVSLPIILSALTIMEKSTILNDFVDKIISESKKTVFSVRNLLKI